MKTLYVIDQATQRDLIIRAGAPHDLEAPILAKVIDWPWMRPWSSPFGEGAKVWARVQEISKPLGVAFLDAGKATPPRLNSGVGADSRIMAQLKDRSNLREGAWTCVEIIADAREDGQTNENREAKSPLKGEMGEEFEDGIKDAADACPVETIEFEEA